MAQGGIQFRRANEIKGFPRKACFAWDSPAPASTWSAARPDCLPDFRGGGRASAGVGGPAQRGAPPAHTRVLPEAKPWRKAEFSSAAQMKSKGSRAKRALRGIHPHRRVSGALQGLIACRASAEAEGHRRVSGAPRSGARLWRTQAFCRRQNLGARRNSVPPCK